MGKADEAEKQLSILAERARVAETAVDILQRQLEAKEMLVDSMIEDQQGCSRQSSVESLNIDTLMKDEPANGQEEEDSCGWCDVDHGGSEHETDILPAKKDKHKSISHRETPSEPRNVRV